MKTALSLLGWLLLLGVPKTLLEQHVLRSERAAGFQAVQWNMGLRHQIGQLGFVAALSGFRALMADVLWLKGSTVFERAEWGRLKLFLESATQLQPRAELFWEMAHFHMAYDAAYAVRVNEELQPSAALRRRAERQYLEIGERFLKDGISFNPDSSRLLERLGMLYANKMHDPARAAEAYLAASQKPRAMEYVRGFAGYQLAKVPGREREAYELLKSVRAEKLLLKRELPPTLLRILADLEARLGVPTESRLVPGGSNRPVLNR
jgi:hypothetical protein